LEAGGYKLVGGRECHLFPGSDLYGKSPEWLVAAEVRETSRVFLSRGVEIRPDWILQVAEPFCTRRWFEPQWNPQRGFVEVLEEVSFRGMVLTRGRRVDYARVDAAACSEIFWREAIVEGQVARPFPFMEANGRVVDTLHGLEARLRRWGLAPTPERQVAWYVAQFPTVNSIKTLQDFIHKNGEKALRFKAEDWLSDSGSEINMSQVKAVESIGERLENKASGVHGGTAQAGGVVAKGEGSVEVFRVMGHELRGHLVFDAARNDDGLSIAIPFAIWQQITPASLALMLRQWREWMLDSLIRELSPTVRKKVEGLREKWDDAWCDLLEKRTNDPPLLLLYEVCAARKEFEGQVPVLQPQKEHHLRLHLELVDPMQDRRFPLELSPEWGCATVFDKLRTTLFPTVAGLAIEPVLRADLPVGEWRYGWRLGRFAAMDPGESAYWQGFLARTMQASVPGLADLFNDRLALLESGGLHLCNWEHASREQVFRSLLGGSEPVDESIRYWEKKLERFSGLEHARGAKVSSFQDLARKAPSGAEEIRLGLVRLTWEAGLLSRDAFAKAWGILRDCVLRIRRGQPPAREWGAWGEELAASEGQYARLACVSRVLGVDEEIFTNNPPRHVEKMDSKIWRERFRPYLAGRNVNDSTLKAVRQLLARIEMNENSENEYFDLEIRATVLWDECRLESFRKGGATGSEDESAIEVADLARLKGAFGKIRK